MVVVYIRRILHALVQCSIINTATVVRVHGMFVLRIHPLRGLPLNELNYTVYD